jgi:hypothetical protein
MIGINASFLGLILYCHWSEHTTMTLTGGPTSTLVSNASSTATQNATLTATGSGGPISTGVSGLTTAKATGTISSTNGAFQSSSPSATSRSEANSRLNLKTGLYSWVAGVSGWLLGSGVVSKGDFRTHIIAPVCVSMKKRKSLSSEQ